MPVANLFTMYFIASLNCKRVEENEEEGITLFIVETRKWEEINILRNRKRRNTEREEKKGKRKSNVHFIDLPSSKTQTTCSSYQIKHSPSPWSVTGEVRSFSSKNIGIDSMDVKINDIIELATFLPW